MKKADYIIIIIVLIIGIGSIGLNLSSATSEGAVIHIYVDGELYASAFLDENQTIEVVTDYGYNNILIEDGEVSVLSADCRDGLCVQMKAISHSGQHIVCLPHHMHIEIESDDHGEVEIDAISQ